jgi:hypothetical protein
VVADRSPTDSGSKAETNEGIVRIAPFSGGIVPLAFGKPIAASVVQAMLLRV